MRPHGYAGAAWLHSSAVPQPSALPDAVLDVSGNTVSGRRERGDLQVENVDTTMPLMRTY